MDSIYIARRQLMLAGGAICAGLGGTAAAQARKAVRPVRGPFDSFWFGSYLVKAGLEQLGYTVEEPKVMTIAAMFQSIAQGDADFTLDVVMPNAAATYEQVKDRVSLLGPTVAQGSVTGYLIDKQTAMKHNIRFVDDLKDPKNAALFSDGSDQRARLIGPGAGFSDEKRAQDDLKRLGWSNTVNLVVGEYSVMVADVVARFKAGKPVFLYAWYPNVATMEMLPGRDLVWLEERNANPAFNFTHVPGCASGNKTCNSGWSTTSYFVGANTKWTKDNAPAAKFLASMRLTLEDRVQQNILMVKGEKRERDLQRHALDWIKANQVAFDGWIAAARA